MIATFPTRDADGVLAGAATSAETRVETLLVPVSLVAGEIAFADVERCVAAGAQAALLSGVRTGADLGHLAALLAVAEARMGRADGATRVVAEVTTAHGLLELRSLVGATPRLAGLAWDADALRADLGAAVLRNAEGRLLPPLAQARSLVLIAAAAAGVPAIDTSSSEDGDAFRQECREALRDGFTAKLVTTTEQLRIVREIAG
ncbi:aldolase/citrate lyase family protein [Methylopila sp. 73B]|uniref:aldolase/citrate lyase family protein n=1 Tax=Methylopila sp. 73B TaxID=1120792 RepID=UPI001FD8943D|nr:aldolase/citrate lyase family protein [Methylopila sp. 73B]